MRSIVLAATLLIVAALDASGVRAFTLQRSAATQLGRQNTWSARSSTGLTLNGTWTATIDPKTRAVSGTWTLLDANGQITMRGGWSAMKSTSGWTGTWRASVAGGAGEYAGSWNATLDLKPNAPFADLFALSAEKVVSGGWRAGGASGSWSIRAFTSP